MKANEPFWETNINPITGYKFESYATFKDRRTPSKELHVDVSREDLNHSTKTLFLTTKNYFEL